MISFILNCLLVLVPAAAIGLWWTGARARELATGHARTACRGQSLQFLDDTVALARVRPTRNDRGASVLQRHYRFEFTSHGQYRDAGEVVMRGYQLAAVRFPYVRDADGNRVYLQ